MLMNSRELNIFAFFGKNISKNVFKSGGIFFDVYAADSWLSTQQDNDSRICQD